jgi:ABC-type antimicrobial peptide transport system permease subunit
LIDDFRRDVSDFFSNYVDINKGVTHSLTIYESLFHRIVKHQMDNIVFVEIGALLLYFVSALISFIAGYLLTRRHKLEVAIMRSIGISKHVMLLSLMAEQILLYAAGTVLGSVLSVLVFGDYSLLLPLIFMGFYILGSLTCGIGAMGKNIHRILVQKER